ncbi:hypothetical protein GLAREA_02952 [Glarea lozoyensis ATCC 20868]|uniref:GPI mannosyltransferase 2 n=1 Tax=Glarea lozoyensis (strain ATCC 20868 / MF5171) TaxID=1116229 RepID=S3DKF4_GLAL2|nr:uncharacterized protein GLAREA_02952 [Glarea lozoyensis ATCC 20868]EPE27038.1 hypothetical protein GLAREA_02952 [Glarea lozoyensis ATCC 20868]
MVHFLQSSRLLENPLRSLVVLFIVWKTLLILLACCSPGPGYDTSTLLLPPWKPSHGNLEHPTGLSQAVSYVSSKLTRWDAIYFVQASKRGYVFEQEWAFGWGFTRLIKLIANGIVLLGIPRYDTLEVVVAIFIAHLSHLVSTLLLFKLTIAIFPARNVRFGLVAAVLHILSPAGLFLSAPYAESSCAMLSFAGSLLFVQSSTAGRPASVGHDALILLSGIAFGIATTFRSNGILNGLLLLEEASKIIWNLQYSFNFASIRRLVFTGMGGLFVASGFILPQYIAYTEYCLESNVSSTRPWCGNVLPSIYTFVQDYYWNVGPFRYWTTSNIPLFLIAAPMFAFLVKSSIWTFTSTQSLVFKETNSSMSPTLRNMAISQLLLALLTLTTAHVQIISRISSSFPVWVWYGVSLVEKKDGGLGSVAVRYMVMYAIIQGGLFASFLPPA